MKKIPVTALRAGQIFTEPVYIQDNNLFIPAGIPIKKKEIDRLKMWEIESVYTTGEAVVTALSPSDSKATFPNKQPEDTNRTATTFKQLHFLLPAVVENSSSYRDYLGFIEKITAIFNAITTGTSVDSRLIDNLASQILQAVRQDQNRIVGYILGGEVVNHTLAKSSVNTAIISTRIAMEMKIPPHKLLKITTGALLHDVGMLKLPQEILNKKSGLSIEEQQRILAHPLYAYKIICKELLYPEDVGVIALQHHERWDGEGYPRRLVGPAIDLGARIVSVADAFEAMVSKKPYRTSMIGYQAIKNILSDNARRFDPEVVRVFIKTMGIYPIGSIVLLNTGAVARVVEVHSDAPLRPKIRILIDEFSKVYTNDTGELVDLLMEKSLFIARAIDSNELSQIK